MPKAIDPNDILKRKFGKLTVEGYAGRKVVGRNGYHMYICSCSCGATDVMVLRRNLLSGDTTSCGCAHKDAGNAVIEDLAGRVFGRWRVIERAPNRVSPSGKTRSIMWLCECECGTRKIVGARALKTGMSTSCGCLQKERVSEANTDDLTGREFTHLKVMYRNGSRYPRNYGIKGRKSGVRAVWHCVCDCGNECDVAGEFLKTGDITSCGCSHSSKYEHHVVRYLESLGYARDVDFFKEKTFPGLVGLKGGALRFDFFVRLRSGENVLIECQGEQHIRATDWFGGDTYLASLQAHDELKRNFADENHIRFIEINHKNVTYEDVSKCLSENGII